MRAEPTKAEKALWDVLRDYKRDGFRFRRQVPFDNYIVDFACHSAKLIIEVDGQTHSSDKEITYDVKRQAFLESRGYKVMRFWNEDIFKSLHQVIAEIETFLMPPTPNPSPRGGGGCVEASPRKSSQLEKIEDAPTSPFARQGRTKGGGQPITS